MIRSEAGRGLIYAGDTPLACDIVAEQTGPMQVTVRAGSFTTTGLARIRTYDPRAHDALIASGRGELLADGRRVRGWIQNRQGQPIDKSVTYTLAVDQVITLVSDPTRPVAYDVDLVHQGPNAGVHVKRKLVGVEEYGTPPAGWKKIHELLFEFLLPPGSMTITPIDIFALTIRPGFPEGIGPDDWMTQTGEA